MSDSLRTDGSRAPDAASDADEKIEQLLLAGLDHYFAARYEQAINVWTRALFLDRSHPRARAYIERARSALAERQRESEELFQRGVAAFTGGDHEEAKQLLTAAVHRGAPAEEAQGLLDRLHRHPEPGLPRTVATDSRPLDLTVSATPRDAPQPSAQERTSSRTLVWTMAGCLLVAAAAGLYSIVVGDGREWSSLLPWSDLPAASMAAPVSREGVPALPRRGEVALGRARALIERGRLREALTTLDMVRATDPEKPEADRARAEIQRRLLGTGAGSRSPASLDRQRGRQP